MTIVGRLAPSPTGELHLGHARSFLVAWWHARSRGGKVILRLDDIDVERASQAHIDAALRDLEWIGLDWDGAPVIESSRLGELSRAAARLVVVEMAYPCVCTRGELARVAAEQARAEEQVGAPQAVRELRYPGTCRDRFHSLAEAERETGQPAGLRLWVEPGTVRFVDEVAGPQSFDVASEVGDFLVQRRSGAPAYQLACVIDDALDGVTEVVRGDDLLPSTARQLLVQRALGLAAPRYAHLPLVLDHSGTRLAKRSAALSLAALRARGVDPRSIVTWAAEVSGQVPGRTGRFTASDLLGTFALGSVPRAPTVLDADPVTALERVG